MITCVPIKTYFPETIKQYSRILRDTAFDCEKKHKAQSFLTAPCTKGRDNEKNKKWNYSINKIFD